MRFLILIMSVCKGIYRGIRKEIKCLAEISHINNLQKQKKEELVLEYQRLGEYIYYVKTIEDEHVLQIQETIVALLEEIEAYEQKLEKLRGGS